MTSRSAAVQTVLLLTSIFFVSCVSRFGMGPLMPAIENDLNVGHAEAGFVFFATSFGYCLGILLSGPVAYRLNYRGTIIASSGAVGAALFWTAFGNSFWDLAAGMTVVGMAGGLYLPCGLATISSVVSPANLGKAFAVHEIAPNISLAFTPFVVELLLGWTTWRGVVNIFGLTALVACGIFFWFGQGSAMQGILPDKAALKKIVVTPSFWVLMLIFSLAIGANVGVYVMLPVFLVSDLGFDRPSANEIVSFSRAFGLVIVLIAGSLTDRWSPKLVMSLILLAGGILTSLLGFLSGHYLLVAVFLQPALAGCFFPVGFTVLSQMGPFVVSLCIPMAFLFGAGVIPAGIGAMAEAGYFSSSLVLVGLLIATGAPLTYFIKHS